MSIRIGILGYGNLGKGVELAVAAAPDMELVAVFTRRDPSSLSIKTAGVPVVSVNDVADYKDKIDVMILCGGSATDLPVQTPQYAGMFNVVDSFDTHARIPEHFANVDAAAREAGKVAQEGKDTLKKAVKSAAADMVSKAEEKARGVGLVKDDKEKTSDFEFEDFDKEASHIDIQ